MKKIIISRTDNLGDVILTLPIAGVLKNLFPNCQVIFLGKGYTKPIIDACTHIDEFLDWSEIQKASKDEQIKTLKKTEADTIIHVFPNKKISTLAKASKIPIRIGTSHRIFHLLTCNQLVKLSRKKSDLHEAQLNLKLLESLGAKKLYSLEEITDCYGFTNPSPLNNKLSALLSNNKFNLILHPKSKGSAREWGLDNFSKLIEILPKNKYQIFISGTQDEGDLMHNFLKKHKTYITDLTGKLSLEELISFISKADGLVAASTGPLHIASALGKHVVGIFAPMRPIHPGRWAPIGEHANYLVLDRTCDDCRKNHDCKCIRSIEPQEVSLQLDKSILPNH